MVMSIVAVVPQLVDGVNVYIVVPVVAVLIVDGAHVPVTPLLDVGGSVGAVEFWHSGPTWVNVGVTLPLMVIAIVAVVPQLVDGVNVYVVVPVVAVFMIDGLHVPAIPLLLDVGNAGAVEF